MSAAPELMQMIRQLVATPSVSCVNPAIDQAHQPDEHLETARILPTVELLRKFIYQFCIQ